MKDVNYLRISLIDRCNFRCQYCMPDEGEMDWLERQELLTKDELLFLIERVFIPLGFDKFRLTGGGNRCCGGMWWRWCARFVDWMGWPI